MIKCFYHSADLDGICSAAIVKYKYPDVELFPINYGDKFPWADIKLSDIVFMVDFGLQPIEDMVKLKESCYLTWIDHHITAIKEAERVGLELPGLRIDGTAGCELTWQYLFPNLDLPWPVYYLGRYDVWDHSNKWVLPFQYGMRLKNLSPDSDKWEILFDESHKNHTEFQCNIIDDGRLIINWETVENERTVSYLSFETVFEGLRAIVCNARGGSTLFQSKYNEEKHDIMISFVYTGKSWNYSFYSTQDNVHCGELAKKLAKKYNSTGGGHKGAAGMNIKEFIF